MLNSARFSKVALRGVCAALTLTCSAFIIGCWQWSHDEVSRVASPDGRTDAVLFEENGGATTSFDYVVDVVPHGEKNMKQVGEIYGAVRNTQAYGVDLRWIDSNTVEADYLTSKTAPVVDSVILDGRKISLVFKEGVTDAAAPSGGMLYNLQKP